MGRLEDNLNRRLKKADEALVKLVKEAEKAANSMVLAAEKIEDSVDTLSARWRNRGEIHELQLAARKLRQASHLVLTDAQLGDARAVRETVDSGVRGLSRGQKLAAGLVAAGAFGDLVSGGVALTHYLESKHSEVVEVQLVITQIARIPTKEEILRDEEEWRFKEAVKELGELALEVDVLATSDRKLLEEILKYYGHSGPDQVIEVLADSERVSTMIGEEALTRISKCYEDKEYEEGLARVAEASIALGAGT